MPMLKIRTRDTEENSIEMTSDISKIAKRYGVPFFVKQRRMCDCCDTPIPTDGKFKGGGMEEYCEKCSIKNKIKGEWKINKY